MVRAGQLELEARPDLRFGGCDRELNRRDRRDHQVLSFDKVIRVGEMIGRHDDRDRNAELSGDARDRVSPFHLVVGRRDGRGRGRRTRCGRSVRERLLLRVAEQRREGLPIRGAATVAAGDGEVDVPAVDGAGDVRTLGAAIDLATGSSAALGGGDLLDDATGNKRAGWTGGVPQEPCRRAPSHRRTASHALEATPRRRSRSVARSRAGLPGSTSTRSRRIRRHSRLPGQQRKHATRSPYACRSALRTRQAAPRASVEDLGHDRRLVGRDVGHSAVRRNPPDRQCGEESSRRTV